jgi:hypothetical protein
VVEFRDLILDMLRRIFGGDDRDMCCEVIER